MSLASPEILVPDNVPSFRTSSFAQLLGGTFPAEATGGVQYRFDVTKENTGVEPVFSGPLLTAAISYASQNPTLQEDTLPWTFSVALIGRQINVGDILHLQFFSVNWEDATESLPTEISVAFTESETLSILAPVPSGLSVRRNSQYLEPVVLETSLAGYPGELLGYNFYVSLEEGGGVRGYTLLNSEYIATPSGSSVMEAPLMASVAQSGDILTKTQTLLRKSYQEFSYKLTGERLADMVATGLLADQTYDSSVTFYFVVTTVMYDGVLGQVVESPFSAEIPANYVTFSAVYNEIPKRNREQISISMMQRMYGKNKKLNLIASSVYKDILDPVSEEFEDHYVIQDFIAQAQSIRGLIQFDDENGDGVSDAVSSSPKKARLMLAIKAANPSTVQGIIDSYFDKYAANCCITRLKSTASEGKALFYASEVPTEGLYIKDGARIMTGPGYGNNGDAIAFTVKGSRTIPYSSRNVFFNSTEQRYEIEVDIQATATGSLGNVPAGAITQIVTGADPRFRVANLSPSTGGSDKESNLALACRAQLTVAGLDTGSVQGYARGALGVPGVRSVKVQAAGDELMLRDMDSTGNHYGSMVDVYVQSESISEKQDIVAFSYGGPAGAGNGEKFYVEDAEQFRIRTTNSNVTAATPIFEVTRVTNVTRGADYDLAGCIAGVGDGDSIQLALTGKNLSIGLATADVLSVDYKFRGSNTFVLKHQPVRSIVSVVGDVDGRLPVENFSLVRLEDPLLLGNSTKARDGVALNYFGGFPSETTLVVSAEQHMFLKTAPFHLVKKGVDIDSIVLSEDANGVYLYEKDTDYSVGNGGLEGYTYLYLQPYSRIRSGSEVFVSYRHSQNLKVTYTVNEALAEVQEVLDTSRHGTANVVVKGSIQNYVDIYLHVIRERGFSQSSVESKIQTTLGNYVSSLKIGQPLMMDDVIAKVKQTPGVRTVVLPITRMMKQNGSFIQNDYIGYAEFKVYTVNASRGVTAYISVKPVLNYGTVSGGGDSNLFRAVYENNKALVTADTPLGVSEALGRSYIQADGRVIVSTTDGAPPQGKAYRAAYYTYVAPGSEYAADISTDNMENLVVGSNSIKVDAQAEA